MLNKKTKEREIVKHVFAYFFLLIMFGEYENDKIRKSYKKNFIIKMFYTIFKLREKNEKEGVV